MSVLLACDATQSEPPQSPSHHAHNKHKKVEDDTAAAETPTSTESSSPTNNAPPSGEGDACSQAWAEFKAHVDALDGQLRPELEKAKAEANSYARLARLRAVRRQYIESLRQQTPPYQGREFGCGGCGGHDQLYAGLPFDALAAMFETAKNTHRLFLKPAEIVADKPTAEEPGGNPRVGYPWQGLPFDRELYCLAGRNQPILANRAGCTPGYGEACSLYAQLGGSNARRAREERAHQLGQSVYPAEMRAQHPQGNYMLTYEPDHLSKVDPATIYASRTQKADNVLASGTSTIIEIAFQDQRPYAFGCRTTNKVSRIDPDGTVEYFKDHCTEGMLKVEGLLRTTFTELPPDVHLQKGDVIDFAFELTDAKKNVLANTPTLQSVRIVYTAVGRHINSVKRGGATLWHYGA